MRRVRYNEGVRQVKDMTGTIFDIKEMAVHDGPGVRTTVFLKGCPLRCRWCHNPEGLSSAPQLMVKEGRCTHCGRCRVPCSHPECQPFGRCLHACPDGLLSVAGRQISSADLAQELIRSGEPLGQAFGGITFSGGEPLLQAKFVIETAKQLQGIHRCIETSGYAAPEVFAAVAEQMELVIMDIKLADPEAHRRYTGVDNGLIRQNLRRLQQSGHPHLIRTPLIPSITDTEENLAAIRCLIGDSPWKKLPYNTLAGAKYPMLGMTYPLDKKEAPHG